jgi:DNA-binding transcriptional ArsR family regulator
MVDLKQAWHPDVDEMELVSVMAALSDPIGAGVARLLADGRERGWGDLRAPVAKSTLSHHLRVLRDAGITRTRQEGTRCYVTPAPGRPPGTVPGSAGRGAGRRLRR